jgi:hypothetical protein
LYMGFGLSKRVCFVLLRCEFMAMPLYCLR